MTKLATHCPENRKICSTKNRIKNDISYQEIVSRINTKNDIFQTNKDQNQNLTTKIPQKIVSRINTKNDIFQTNKDQNQNLRAPMNCQHNTHKALTTKKRRRVFQRCQN